MLDQNSLRQMDVKITLKTESCLIIDIILLSTLCFLLKLRIPYSNTFPKKKSGRTWTLLLKNWSLLLMHKSTHVLKTVFTQYVAKVAKHNKHVCEYVSNPLSRDLIPIIPIFADFGYSWSDLNRYSIVWSLFYLPIQPLGYIGR